MVVAVALAATACGAAQVQETGMRSDGEFVRAVYTCDSGSIILIEGSSGPVLFDSRLAHVLQQPRLESDGIRFLAFAVMDDHAVALEYFVPENRRRNADVRTFDTADGGFFNVTARRKTWRIRGEPSSQTSCSLADPTEMASR